MRLGVLGAVLAVCLAGGVQAASAGTVHYTFRTNVRTCDVYVDLSASYSSVVFSTMNYGGGLLYCSSPTVAGPVPYLDQADGSATLHNDSSGQDVYPNASFYCRQTTSCENGATQNVLRNNNLYRTHLSINLWLDGSDWCGQWATDSKGHRYCARYDSESWTSVPYGCYISYGLVSCDLYSTQESAKLL